MKTDAVDRPAPLPCTHSAPLKRNPQDAEETSAERNARVSSKGRSQGESSLEPGAARAEQPWLGESETLTLPDTSATLKKEFKERRRGKDKMRK